MKNTLLFSFLLFSITLVAQDVNPFESIGKKGKMLTLSNGKYPEFHPYDSLQRIGSVIVNINTGLIHEMLDLDTLYSESTLEPTVFSRWYSIDPLAAKYPGYSPYNFATNNPILFTDPDGQEIWIATFQQDGNGHVPTKVQYKNGQLYDTKGNVYFAEKGSFEARVLNDLNQLVKDDPILNDRITDLVESNNEHIIKGVPRAGFGSHNAPGPLEENQFATDKRGELIKNPDLPANEAAIAQAIANDKNGIPTGTHTYYDIDKTESEGQEVVPRAVLAHELLGHGWDSDQGLANHQTVKMNGKSPLGIYEFYASQIENIVRAAAGNDLRTTYGPYQIPDQFSGKGGIKTPIIKMSTIPTKAIIQNNTPEPQPSKN